MIASHQYVTERDRESSSHVRISLKSVSERSERSSFPIRSVHRRYCKEEDSRSREQRCATTCVYVDKQQRGQSSLSRPGSVSGQWNEKKAGRKTARGRNHRCAAPRLIYLHRFIATKKEIISASRISANIASARGGSRFNWSPPRIDLVTVSFPCRPLTRLYDRPRQRRREPGTHRSPSSSASLRCVCSLYYTTPPRATIFCLSTANTHIGLRSRGKIARR